MECKYHCRSVLLLQGLKFTIGLRLSKEEEIAGADWAEHRIGLGPDTEIYGERHSVSGLLLSQGRSASRLSKTSIRSEVSDINDTVDNTKLVFRTKSSNGKIKRDQVMAINIPCPSNDADSKTGMSSFI